MAICEYHNYVLFFQHALFIFKTAAHRRGRILRLRCAPLRMTDREAYSVAHTVRRYEQVLIISYLFPVRSSMFGASGRRPLLDKRGAVCYNSGERIRLPRSVVPKGIGVRKVRASQDKDNG